MCIRDRFYEHCYRGSWAQPYLTGRVHTDLTGHPDIRPGYAPNTWTAPVSYTHLDVYKRQAHLRHQHQPHPR